MNPAQMVRPASFLGADADQYLAAIDGLRLAQLKTRYVFTSEDEFGRLLREDRKKATQVYWSEILARAHWTAITAIFRNRRWISAISSAVRDQNMLAFAAAFRGLIESAADTQTALRSVPVTLARGYARIRDATLGKMDSILTQGQIEDDLIHFTHARKIKKSETVPDTHRAKQIQEYLDIFTSEKTKNIAACYKKLCDYTHPGLSSVWLWVRPDGEMGVQLASDQEKELISQFLIEYGSTLLQLLMFGFNGPVLTLSVLNYFPVKSLHTPALANWDLSDLPAWRNIRRDLMRQQVIV